MGKKVVGMLDFSVLQNGPYLSSLSRIGEYCAGGAFLLLHFHTLTPTL